MEKWVILLSAVIFFLVIALTIHYYRKNEKSSAKQSKANGIITQYWQAIVLVSFGVILLIVALLNSF